MPKEGCSLLAEKPPDAMAVEAVELLKQPFRAWRC